MTYKALILAALIGCATPGLASEPEIVAVTANSTGMGWDFDVTVAHADTGWEHYADGWEIVTEDGTVLGYRKLHHPHVDEQPFTRALRHVMVPDGTRKVFLRVRCSADGWKNDLYDVVLKR